MRKIALLVTILLLSACGNTSKDVIPIDPKSDPEIKPIYDSVTSSNIDALLKISDSRTVILDIGATWCGACEAIKPLIKERAKKGNGQWVLGLIDGDESYDLVNRYNVTGYPTLISVKNGREVSRNGPNDWEPWLNHQVKQEK